MKSQFLALFALIGLLQTCGEERPSLLVPKAVVDKEANLSEEQRELRYKRLAEIPLRLGETNSLEYVPFLRFINYRLAQEGETYRVALYSERGLAPDSRFLSILPGWTEEEKKHALKDWSLLECLNRLRPCCYDGVIMRERYIILSSTNAPGTSEADFSGP